MKKLILLITIVALASCNQTADRGGDNSTPAPGTNPPVLNLEQANRLVELPLACVTREYPNKLNQTISSDADLRSPEDLHPAFFGCFDWHSSVHGHWSMVKLLKEFPGMDRAGEVRDILAERITSENIARELEYFNEEQNRTFERTYGWAWLLKLADELRTWDDPLARQLGDNLQPLADHIANMYIEFLPKLNYPIRVGTHTNTAFGLTFAYDYALGTGNDALAAAITVRARDFYLHDAACPMTWEPGGNDFLSPCLEEANLMIRVLDEEEFREWLAAFLPDLASPAYTLEPGIVTDRADGQLAHLDGLNFSRAWALYTIAEKFPEYQHLLSVGDDHINHSLPDITGDHYEGSHWLASFALLALDTRPE